MCSELSVDCESLWLQKQYLAVVASILYVMLNTLHRKSTVSLILL